MMTHGRVTMRRMFSITPCTSAASRYSVTYFMPGHRVPVQLEVGDLLQKFHRLHGFLLTDQVERKADMDDAIIADLCLGHIRHAGFAKHAAEIHLRHLQTVLLVYLDYFCGHT